MILKTVYFRDKSVAFATPDDSAAATADTVLEFSPDLTTAKIVKILENSNRTVITARNPQAAFDAFSALFKQVAAAGGIVRNSRGEVLMIYRRERWDLPKGHLEEGETIEQCAAREIAEETGIGGVKIVAPLCRTLHAYDLYGTWEMKCTHWFLAEGDGSQKTRPQHEEGIDDAVWLSPEQAAEKLRDSYPTIRDVFAAFDKM